MGAPLGMPMIFGKTSSSGGWCPSLSIWASRPRLVLYFARHTAQGKGYAGSGGGSEGSASGHSRGSSGTSWTGPWSSMWQSMASESSSSSPQTSQRTAPCGGERSCGARAYGGGSPGSGAEGESSRPPPEGGPVAGKGAARKYETEAHLESWLSAEASVLVEDRLYLLKVTDITVKVTAGKVTVAYAGSSPVLGGLQTKEQEQAGRKNPVDLLRKTRLLKELAGKV